MGKVEGEEYADKRVYIDFLQPACCCVCVCRQIKRMRREMHINRRERAEKKNTDDEKVEKIFRARVFPDPAI